jgi:hypothetical protein
VPPPVEANTATQQISQVQISGCVEHCAGVTQSQSAEQQNTTVQVVGPGSPRGTESTQPIAPGAGSSVTTRITQLQIGCISYCVDSTPSSEPLPPGVLNAAEQLLTQPLGAALEQLLAALGIGGAPSLAPAVGSEQNVVSQVSSQLQIGAAGGQSQSASQSNTTVQTSAPAATGPGSGDKAPPDPSPSALAAVVNQAEQAILQLQIGCLMFCTQTTQEQQAAQSNTALQVIPADGPGSASGLAGSGVAASGSAVDTAIQLIQQVQIGCLFVCEGATELQSAMASDNVAVFPFPAPRRAGLAAPAGPARRPVPLTA